MAYLHGNGHRWAFLSAQAEEADVQEYHVKNFFAHRPEAPIVLHRICPLACTVGVDDYSGTAPENLTNVHWRALLFRSGDPDGFYTAASGAPNLAGNTETQGDSSDADQNEALANDVPGDRLGYWRPGGTATTNNLGHTMQVYSGAWEYGCQYDQGLWVAAHAYQGGFCKLLVVYD